MRLESKLFIKESLIKINSPVKALYIDPILRLTTVSANRAIDWQYDALNNHKFGI